VLRTLRAQRRFRDFGANCLGSATEHAEIAAERAYPAGVFVAGNPAG